MTVRARPDVNQPQSGEYVIPLLVGDCVSRAVNTRFKHQDVAMPGEKIRRLDRSRPIVVSDIGLHDDVAAQFTRTAREQNVSLGLYLEQLLAISRDPEGRLPVLFPRLDIEAADASTPEANISAA